LFRPAKMKKARILSFKEYKDQLIENLHKAGLIQIKDLTEEIDESDWSSYLEKGRSDERSSEIASKILRINRILDIFKTERLSDKTRLEKIKSFVFPEVDEIEVSDVEDAEKILIKSDEFLESVEKEVNPVKEKLDNIEYEIADLSSFVEEAKDYKDINVPLEYIKTSEYTKAVIGKVSNENVEVLKDKLSDITDLFLLQIEKIDKENSSFLFFSYRLDEEKEIDRVLRNQSKWKFDPPEWAVDTPEEAISKAKEKIEALKEKKKEVVKKISGIRDRYEVKIREFLKKLEICKERAEITGRFANTDRTIMLEGWIPAGNVNDLTQILETSTEGFSLLELQDPEDIDSVPTKLDNPKALKPFERLVEMFNIPGYKELDPTPVVAFSFIVFVGLCLTDIAYGILNLGLAGLMIKGPGRASDSLKDLGWILLISGGISCIIWGVITGGFMGELLSDQLGLLSEGWQPWANPLTEEAVDILVLSLLIGVVYMGFGLLMGFYQSISDGKYKEAFVEHITWFLLLVAGVPIVSVALMADDFMEGLMATVTSPWGMIAIGILVASIVSLIAFSGPMEIMEIPGFFGDILSFARLLALAVATGGIASIVNILAIDVLPTFHPAMIALSIPIFVVGHLGNYMFQTLGSFIHSMRLEYVEFFGTFYVGKGEKFEPFSVEDSEN